MSPCLTALSDNLYSLSLRQTDQSNPKKLKHQVFYINCLIGQCQSDRHIYLVDVNQIDIGNVNAE